MTNDLGNKYFFSNLKKIKIYFKFKINYKSKTKLYIICIFEINNDGETRLF